MKNIAKILLIILFLGIFGASVASASSVAVNLPASWSNWRIGESKLISWAASPLSSFYKIELWEDSVVLDRGSVKGGNVWRINESVVGTSYIWKVGNVDCGGSCTPPSAGKYKVIVRDGDSSVLGESVVFNVSASVSGIAMGNNVVTSPQVPVKPYVAQAQPQSSVSPSISTDTQASVAQMASALDSAKQILTQMLSRIKILFGR